MQSATSDARRRSDAESPDVVGVPSSNSLGVGAIVKLKDPFSLLVSSGPRWSGGQTNLRFYAALALNF